MVNALNCSRFLIYFLFFIFEKEREHKQRRGRERETESEAGSRLRTAAETNVGLELVNYKIMTWADVRCLTDWATQAPLICPLLNGLILCHMNFTSIKRKVFVCFFFFFKGKQDLIKFFSKEKREKYTRVKNILKMPKFFSMREKNL